MKFRISYFLLLEVIVGHLRYQDFKFELNRLSRSGDMGPTMSATIAKIEYAKFDNYVIS